MNDFSHASAEANPDPFPRRILCARSPHRLPRLPKHEELIAKLLRHGINAAAFLMDVDLIALSDAKSDFTNDPKLALEDLKKQLRALDAVLCEKLFPTPKPLSVVEKCWEDLRRRRFSSSSSDSASSDGDQSDNANELSIPLPGESSRRRSGIEFPPGRDDIGGR